MTARLSMFSRSELAVNAGQERQGPGKSIAADVSNQTEAHTFWGA